MPDRATIIERSSDSAGSEPYEPENLLDRLSQPATLQGYYQYVLNVPLSPRHLLREIAAVGLRAELHAVSYIWRRLPPRLQVAMRPLDRVGSRPRAARFGHTLLLIARRL